MTLEFTKQPALPAYKAVIPRKILQAAANIVLVAVIGGSFLPPQEKLKLGTQQRHAGLEGKGVTRHRAYHFASFGLAALAFMLLASRIKEEVKTATFIFGLGCAIEGAQCLLARPHVMEWWDIRDDLYAIVATFLVVQAANALSARKLPTPSPTTPTFGPNPKNPGPILRGVPHSNEIKRTEFEKSHIRRKNGHGKV